MVLHLFVSTELNNLSRLYDGCNLIYSQRQFSSTKSSYITVSCRPCLWITTHFSTNSVAPCCWDVFSFSPLQFYKVTSDGHKIKSITFLYIKQIPFSFHCPIPWKYIIVKTTVISGLLFSAAEDHTLHLGSFPLQILTMCFVWHDIET